MVGGMSAQTEHMKAIAAKLTALANVIRNGACEMVKSLPVHEARQVVPQRVNPTAGYYKRL